MTPIEDLLRSATREEAAQITPGSIRPLEVAALRGPRAVRRMSAHRLAVPLAAAAAVVLVAGLSLALPRILASSVTTPARSSSAPSSSAPSSPAPSSPAPSSPAPSSPAASAGGQVPAIYAALTGVTYPWYDHPLDLTVRNTETGAVLATIQPPAPYGTFALVGHASPAGTFLVGVQRWQPVSNSSYVDNNNAAPITLLLLHFDQATRQASFTSLPAPVLPGLESGEPVLEGASLSPDGTKLAVATGDAVPPAPTSLELSVYSLPGGAVRTWSLHGTAAAKSQDAVSALSWLTDGHTLALNMTGLDPGGRTVNQVRKLDVNGPSGDLLGASQLVFSLDARTFLCQDSPVLSPDGTTVACAGQIPPQASQQSGTVTYGFAEFSVATGRRTGILARTTDGASVATSPQLFWWDGHDTLIGTLDGPVFVLRDGTEQAIPWSSRISGPQGGSPEAAW
jgi:hypothetical protein